MKVGFWWFGVKGLGVEENGMGVKKMGVGGRHFEFIVIKRRWRVNTQVWRGKPKENEKSKYPLIISPINDAQCFLLKY